MERNPRSVGRGHNYWGPKVVGSVLYLSATEALYCMNIMYQSIIKREAGFAGNSLFIFHFYILEFCLNNNKSCWRFVSLGMETRTFLSFGNKHHLDSHDAFPIEKPPND